MSATTAIVFVGLLILALLVVLVAVVWRYLSRSERQRKGVVHSTLSTAGGDGSVSRTPAAKEAAGAAGARIGAADAQVQQANQQALADAAGAREARRLAEQEIQALQDGLGRQRVDIQRRGGRLAARGERLG